MIGPPIQIKHGEVQERYAAAYHIALLSSSVVARRFKSRVSADEKV